MSSVLKRLLSATVQSIAKQSSRHQFLHQSQQLHSNFTTNYWFGQQILRTMSTANKPKIVFVLGAPGSGKGTQCAHIVTEYNYVHLSAGDLLRAERNRPGSEIAQTIEEYIQAGEIIPVEVTCSLIERAMNEETQVSCTLK